MIGTITAKERIDSKSMDEVSDSGFNFQSPSVPVFTIFGFGTKSASATTFSASPGFRTSATRKLAAAGVCLRGLAMLILDLSRIESRGSTTFQSSSWHTFGTEDAPALRKRGQLSMGRLHSDTGTHLTRAFYQRRHSPDSTQELSHATNDQRIDNPRSPNFPQRARLYQRALLH